MIGKHVQVWRAPVTSPWPSITVRKEKVNKAAADIIAIINTLDCFEDQKLVSELLVESIHKAGKILA